LDELDSRIIELLRRDSRSSFVELGHSVGLSEGAVRNRVKNLMRQGIIKRFTIETQIKEGVKAIVLVSSTPSIPTPTIAERIRSIQGVEAVYEVTGQYDVAAVLVGDDIAAVNKAIEGVRRIEGIQNTNSLIVLKSWY
jgi:Lrp/AsnC family transcriptional regulator of lysine biosynthesis